MKQKIIYIILIVTICWIGCSQERTPLEDALEKAGTNRKELEKVLEHYQSDSLKYRAAEFLIENMPYHYSYVGKELKKYHSYFKCFAESPWRGPEFIRDSLFKANGIFYPDSLRKVPDLQNIKADFLIQHIDFAFKVWREQPWGHKITFDNFLEFILPYRVGTEGLSLWREKIYARYNPMLDSIRASADSSNILAVAQALIDSLSTGTICFTGLFPSGITVGPQIVKWRSGNCRELTDLVTYVFRAVGLPAGCDKMLMRGDKNVAHYWNFITDEENNIYFASIGLSSKTFAKADTYWDPKGKVYRETFSLNRLMCNELGDDLDNIPKVFQKPLMRDVTISYAGSTNQLLRIPIDSLIVIPHEGEKVYLCLSTRESWVPVGFGYFSNDTVRIDNVQGSVVFRLVIYRKGRMISLGEPFQLDKYNGSVRFFRASEKTQKAILLQKFKEDFQAHMIGGVFEADSYADFRHPDTLYIIKERPSRLINIVHLSDNNKVYRYVRYFGPPNRHCNISEMAFYSSEKMVNALKGNIISPHNVIEGHIVNQFHNVFDNDPYTSMDYREPSGGWVGLDFGRPVKIEKIIYTPRNRDNFIRKGDNYELFFATAKGWVSLGEQTATSDSIVYNVPIGALLYLRDHTRGVDDRIFEMVNGKQKLW